MGNNDLLTGAEFDTYLPHSIMVDHVERCRARFGAARNDFRIVDWGCGRGRLVLWLRDRGYDAVGVDIDPKPFAKGADIFRAKGYAVEECLRGLNPQGTAPFADSRFHFITSSQAIEHLQDLEGVAAEWGRLTMDGGGGFHIYPSHRRFVEGHLFMPFVHWLPKAMPRRWLIGLFVLLGIEPHWWAGRKVSWEEKVRTYYEYSVNETFYRSPGVVRRCLAARGFHTEFVDVDAGRPCRMLAQKWVGLNGSSKLVRAWYMNFSDNVGLATSLHKRGPASR